MPGPTTRRHLIATAGALPLASLAFGAGMAATVTPDDAELIAIGREADALLTERKPLQARWWALPAWTLPGSAEHAELNAIGDAIEPIDARLEVLGDRAMTLRATSRDAMAVKAKLIRHDLSVCHVHDRAVAFEAMEPSQRLAWSLVEDLVGAGVA